MKLDKTGWIRLTWLAVTAALALLVLIAALGHQLNDQVHAATSDVNVGQTNGGGGEANEFNSADITIAEGDTVDFDWYGGVHDVTSYAGGDGTPDWATSSFMVGPGTYSKTFATAGVVTYYCTIHANWEDAAPGAVDANIASGDSMVGKITIEAAAVDTPTATETTTPTDSLDEATATSTTTPTATSTEESPAESPADATATTTPTATATEAAAEATPTATATSEPATATKTPSDATATAPPPTAAPTDAPPTATATEEPAATSQPTATDGPSATPLPRTLNVEAGNEWFGASGNQNGADEITINAGDTVQWNVVEGVHTVYECGEDWNKANGCAGAAWSSDILQTGEIFSQRFSAAGTYYYLCTLHPLTMRGAVTVEGSASPNAAAPAATSTGPTTPSTGNPSASSPPPNSHLPTGLANSGYGPLSQESARPDSPLGRAIIIAAAAVALLAAASVWKEVAWRIRN